MMKAPLPQSHSNLLMSLVIALLAGCTIKIDDGATGTDDLGSAPGSYGGYRSGTGGSSFATAAGGTRVSNGTGGSAATACDTVLFDNGNLEACTDPTDTSVFSLSAASRVTALSLWVNTNLSGSSATYELSNSSGVVLSTGLLVKGGCDVYQKNWCELRVDGLNLALAAGTYEVESSAVATCANSKSNYIGVVNVKGCASAGSATGTGGAANTPGAGGATGTGGRISVSTGGTGGGTSSGTGCANPGPFCKELAACCPTLTFSADVKTMCENEVSTCKELNCDVFLHGTSVGIYYCHE